MTELIITPAEVGGGGGTWTGGIGVVISANGGTSSPIEITPVAGSSGAEGIFFPRGENGIWPVPVHEDTFTESSISEGDLLVNAKDSNPTGSAPIIAAASDGSALSALWQTWEKLVHDVRRYGGLLTLTPPDGSAITYELLTMKITETPFDRIFQQAHMIMSNFEFTCKPYGMLPETIIATNQNTATPLLVFEVPPLSGSVEALGILTITNNAAATQSHLEGGLESRFYDATNPWDLLIHDEDMTLLDSATSSTVSGDYGTTSITQSLTTTSKGIAQVTGSHTGQFRVKARVHSSALTTQIRMGYSIRGNNERYGEWTSVPVSAAWSELDLGVARIDAPSIGDQQVTFSIYGRTTTGTATVYLDFLKLLPAERYFKATGAVGGTTTVGMTSPKTAVVRYDGIYTETASGVYTRHPSALGSYLRIPTKGGRIAVFLNRNDLDVAAAGTVTDSVRADLTVIPRVVLLGG